MEEFFKSYQHTFSAFSSIGTVCAVAVALYFGYKAATANKTKIQASAYISNLWLPDENGAYKPELDNEFITIEIVNNGLLPVRIPLSFFYLKNSFEKGFLCFHLPSDYKDQNYPVTIAPNSSNTFQISTPEKLKEILRERKWSFFTRRFAKGYVVTDNGYKKKVKLLKSFKKIVRGGK